MVFKKKNKTKIPQISLSETIHMATKTNEARSLTSEFMLQWGSYEYVQCSMEFIMTKVKSAVDLERHGVVTVLTRLTWNSLCYRM